MFTHLLAIGLSLGLMVRLAFALLKLRTRLSGTTIVVDGRRYEYHVDRSRARSIYRMRLGIGVPNEIRFLLRRERALDGVAKLLQIARELDTGDPAFDSHIYILCDDPLLLDAFTRDVELRARAFSLLRIEDVLELHCNDGMLWVTAITSEKYDDEAAASDLARAVGEALRAMGQRLEALRIDTRGSERDPYPPRETVFNAIAFGLALVGMISSFRLVVRVELPRVLTFENIDQLAAWVTLATWLTLSAAAFLLMRGSSRAHVVLMEILITAAPAAYLTGRAALTEFDMRADAAPFAPYVARVTDTYVVKGRRRDAYYVVIDRSPDPRIERKLRLEMWLQGNVRDDSCVELGFRAGRLGDPWLEYLQPWGVSCEALAQDARSQR